MFFGNTRFRNNDATDIKSVEQAYIFVNGENVKISERLPLLDVRLGFPDAEGPRVNSTLDVLNKDKPNLIDSRHIHAAETLEQLAPIGWWRMVRAHLKVMIFEIRLMWFIKQQLRATIAANKKRVHHV